MANEQLQGQPQEQPQQAEQGGGARELVTGINQGLTKLADGLAQSGMEAEAQALAQVIQQFQQIVESLGDPAAKQPAGQSVSPSEVGAAKAEPVA